MTSDAFKKFCMQCNEENYKLKGMSCSLCDCESTNHRCRLVFKQMAERLMILSREVNKK